MSENGLRSGEFSRAGSVAGRADQTAPNGPGVGPITALTWALEIGDVARFRTMKQAISYCGLCGAEKSSAEKVMRTPLSKQRNKHIQHVLVEAAKLAPRQASTRETRTVLSASLS